MIMIFKRTSSYIRKGHASWIKFQPYPKTNRRYSNLKWKGPFTHLSINIIGPLEKTSNNNQYIIVMVDDFYQMDRSWTHRENVTSKEVIKNFLSMFSAPRYGVPLQMITTDSSVQFTSDRTKIIFLIFYDV